MIPRADFAVADQPLEWTEKVSKIALSDLDNGLLGSLLRKPDFQRETNHWSPEQVVSLLECFVNGDLIPSVILWQSPSHVFVIDGGHRLSALRAWIEDDYGDKNLSFRLFGDQIHEQQKRSAKRTRALVDERLGSWKHFKDKFPPAANIPEEERKRILNAGTRGLPIQWVEGDANKAESSFFKINTQGTPLDSIEETLLKNRGKSLSIAARAVIRAGKGHRYWSAFSDDITCNIEKLAADIHRMLWEPEIDNPIKTLDLPLGGSKGVRSALEVLIEMMLIAYKNHSGFPSTISDQDDDVDGSETVKVLKTCDRLVSRISGNDRGSLGLHPAVYFYGPTGRHSSAMFMGLVWLFSKQIRNNNKKFFISFTNVRGTLEDILVEHKEMIATILQKHGSRVRVERYADMLEDVIASIDAGMPITDPDLVRFAKLEGKIVVGQDSSVGTDFSDDTKSKAFIRTALSKALRCEICNGYLDVRKSVSYDHVKRRREGGKGSVENCAMVHPYCNQSVKN